MSKYKSSDSENQEPIPVTGRAETHRIRLCEICGSDQRVLLAGLLDHGTLQLCEACRRLFGYADCGGKNDGKQ